MSHFTIVIDEVHLFIEQKFTNGTYNKLLESFEKYPAKRYIGMTASITNYDGINFFHDNKFTEIRVEKEKSFGINVINPLDFNKDENAISMAVSLLKENKTVMLYRNNKNNRFNISLFTHEFPHLNIIELNADTINSDQYKKHIINNKPIPKNSLILATSFIENGISLTLEEDDDTVSIVVDNATSISVQATYQLASRFRNAKKAVTIYPMNMFNSDKTPHTVYRNGFLKKVHEIDREIIAIEAIRKSSSNIDSIKSSNTLLQIMQNAINYVNTHNQIIQSNNNNAEFVEINKTLNTYEINTLLVKSEMQEHINYAINTHPMAYKLAWETFYNANFISRCNNNDSTFNIKKYDALKKQMNEESLEDYKSNLFTIIKQSTPTESIEDIAHRLIHENKYENQHFASPEKIAVANHLINFCQTVGSGAASSITGNDFIKMVFDKSSNAKSKQSLVNSTTRLAKEIALQAIANEEGTVLHTFCSELELGKAYTSEEMYNLIKHYALSNLKQSFFERKLTVPSAARFMSCLFNLKSSTRNVNNKLVKTHIIESRKTSYLM
jgi:hypothetical protein